MTQAFMELVKFFVMVFGNTMNSHKTFVEHLTVSSNFTQVNSVNDCNAIIAFVSVVSRSGTDIEAALHKIPASQPLVLVVLHHTFDENYIAPDSRRCVRNRSDVFTVDCLHHEDKGLLRCLHNDEAIRAVKQHLRDMYPESHKLLPRVPQLIGNYKNRTKALIVTVIAVFLIIVLLIVIGILIGQL